MPFIYRTKFVFILFSKKFSNKNFMLSFLDFFQIFVPIFQIATWCTICSAYIVLKLQGNLVHSGYFFFSFSIFHTLSREIETVAILSIECKIQVKCMFTVLYFLIQWVLFKLEICLMLCLKLKIASQSHLLI